MTALEKIALRLRSSELEREREEEFKRRVTAGLWRVEAGLVTSARLYQQIEAELEIVRRHRDEYERRLVDWSRRAPARRPGGEGEEES